MVKRIAGIDWAVAPNDRALVVLELDGDHGLRVAQVASRLPDADALKICTGGDCRVVGVDTPFGWPSGFSTFVGAWNASRPTASPPGSESFCYRHTDKVIRKEVGKTPLSVSSDRIALAARAWASLANTDGVRNHIDVEGTPGTGVRVIEVYPAGTIMALSRSFPELRPAATESVDGQRAPSYKKDAAVRARLVHHLLDRLEIAAPSDVVARLVQPAKQKRSDEADAFVAAITALLYDQAMLRDGPAFPPLGGWQLRCPAAEELEHAWREGWIFFPMPPPAAASDEG